MVAFALSEQEEVTRAGGAVPSNSTVSPSAQPNSLPPPPPSSEAPDLPCFGPESRMSVVSRALQRRCSAHPTSSWEKVEMTELDERTEPWKDPIVAEVRRHHEALFAEAYDIRELCRRLRERQEVSGHRVLKRSKTAAATERQ